MALTDRAQIEIVYISPNDKPKFDTECALYCCQSNSAGGTEGHERCGGVGDCRRTVLAADRATLLQLYRY